MGVLHLWKGQKGSVIPQGAAYWGTALPDCPFPGDSQLQAQERAERPWDRTLF